MALQQVKATVDGLRVARNDADAVSASIENILKDGLKGNRAVNGDLWSVVLAATRAFPIQLSPGVEKAQIVVEASAELALAQVWILQAVADGSLVTLLQSLKTQPQILTAYDSRAPIRNAATSKELILLIQELQGLIVVTPYDKYLQHKAAQKPTADAPLLLVRVQTEDDLPHHVHRHSNSSSGSQQQQQQQQEQVAGSTAPLGDAPGQQEPPPAPSSITAAQPAAEGGASAGHLQDKAAAGGGAPHRIGKTLLMGAFARKSSSSVSSGRTAVSSSAAEQQGSGDPSSHLLVRLQLHVVQPVAGNLSVQQQQEQPRQQLLKAQITVISSNSSSKGTSSSSSSSKLLGAGTDAVKGFLHNLQQSASSSLQQSAAAAAGHDITGAVAAAGEAVAAAIGQPFSAVKGLAAAATNRSGPKGGSSSSKSSPKGGSSSSSPKQEPGEAGTRAAANRSPHTSAATSRSSSLHLPKFLQSKQSTPAAAGGGGSTSAVTPTTASGVLTATPQLVRLQLIISDDSATDQPLTCTLTAVAEASTPSGWGAKSLMQRLASRGQSSKEPKQQQQQQQQQQALGDLKTAAAAAAAAAPAADAAGGDGDVLEGDMWSVMARLRSSSTATSPAAAAPEPLPTAAAGSQQVQQPALDLLQQLLHSCSRVIAAATASKGCLGDESPELLQYINLIKQLLVHGLKLLCSSDGAAAAGESKGPTAAAAFTGWLSPKNLTAFGVLQVLQHGSKQHPRLMLGADSISNMQAAKDASPAIKLDLWVRSSLNEQLLGVRISTLVANPTAVAQYYQPQALLLQQQEMQEVLQQLGLLSGIKFVLLVEATAAVAAGGSGGGSSGVTAAATAAEGMSGSSSSSKGITMDPRRLLGGFGKSFNALRSGSNTTAASAAVPPPATAADQAPPAAQAAAPGSSSSTSIPTFLWAPLGSSSSSNTDPAAAGSASILKRGQRRLANILEVRVPPPDSAAVLSPENSCALSPVSTPGDAAYAEWWSPNSSWQDLQASGAFDRETSPQYLVPDDHVSSSSENLGSAELSGGSSGSRSGRAAAAAGSSGSPGRGSAECLGLQGSSRGLSSSSNRPSSAAARKLEEELSAAMSAPMQVLLEQRRKRGSSSSGSGAGGAALHRSSSSGWDAAVAAARARGRSTVGASVGVSSRAHISKVNLHGRSRSPEADWPAAAAGHSSGPGVAEAAAAAAEAQGAVGAVPSRVVRHRHKRSSSLNDLPELAALLEDEGRQP